MRISDWSSDVCSSDLPPAPSAVRTWLFLTSDRHQIADPRIILNKAHAQHTPAPPKAAVEPKPSAPPDSHCPAPVPAPRVPALFDAAPVRHDRSPEHSFLRPDRRAAAQGIAHLLPPLQRHAFGQPARHPILHDARTGKPSGPESALPPAGGALPSPSLSATLFPAPPPTPSRTPPCTPPTT